MKELSIKEKAQRYDEAIERAKGVIEQNPLMEYLKKGIEYILPELKESEDERIRKDMIETIKKESKDFPSSVIAEKSHTWLAWIEKQGEQNLDTDFSSLRTWKYIVDAVWTEKEGIGQYLDSPFTEEVAKKLQKRFGNIEPKLSWSEEEEKRISSILLSIEYCKEQYPDLREYQYDIDWLKSLKDRVQPKQEWSEEDEKILKEIITDVKFEGYNNDMQANSYKKINWLKNFKDKIQTQSQWKPTKEQMFNLFEAAHYNCAFFDMKILKGLYNDLKQL